VIAAAALYIALMACGWGPPPWQLQIADVVFPALLVLAVRSARWQWRRLDVGLLAFIAGTALSMPGSVSVRQSAMEVAKEGYLFAAYLTLAAVMARAGVRPIIRWLPIAAAVAAALSLVAGIVFVVSGSVWTLFGQPMPLPYVGQVFRMTGTFETPEFFGNLLTVALPLAIVCRTQAADRRRWTAALILMAMAAALTFSKALAGCVIAATIVLWPDWRERRFGGVLRFAAASLAIVLVVAFNLSVMWTIRKIDLSFGKDASVPAPTYMYALQDAAGADSVEVRIAYNPMSYYLLKQAAWTAWRRQPVFGTGAGTFVLDAERAYQEGRLGQGYRHLAAHSTIFGRLAETGSVGLITLTVAWIGIALCARQAVRSPGSDGPLALACAAGLAGLLVNGINVDVMHFRFLWLAIAAIRAASVSDPLSHIPAGRGAR
jgi:hypothetical protein